MITLAPYDDHRAAAVLSNLDPSDLIEAQLVRGAGASHLQLFREWAGMQAGAVVSLVLLTRPRGTPVAVMALGHTGQAGVAQAALLARSHKRFRRQLGELGLQIRRDLPAIVARSGIRRIEARCWAGHPTAAKFLWACGFTHEAAMPGFGATGAEIFHQFAWTPKQESQDVLFQDT